MILYSHLYFVNDYSYSYCNHQAQKGCYQCYTYEVYYIIYAILVHCSFSLICSVLFRLTMYIRSLSDIPLEYRGVGGLAVAHLWKPSPPTHVCKRARMDTTKPQTYGHGTHICLGGCKCMDTKKSRRTSNRLPAFLNSIQHNLSNDCVDTKLSLTTFLHAFSFLQKIAHSYNMSIRLDYFVKYLFHLLTLCLLLSQFVRHAITHFPCVTFCFAFFLTYQFRYAKFQKVRFIRNTLLRLG